MKTKILNLIELVGHCELHLILVDPAFDLDKDNDEMLDVDWDNEPLMIEMFFDVAKVLDYCQKQNVLIGQHYWGKIY